MTLQLFKDAVATLPLVPRPHQLETLRAMFFACTATNEDFIAFWPRRNGLTTMCAMFVAILLRCGFCPPRIGVLSETVDRNCTMVEIFAKLIGKPDDTFVDLSWWDYTFRQKRPVRILTEVLADALPSFSLDVLGVVASYSDYGYCVISFMDLRPDVPHPDFDILICDLPPLNTTPQERWPIKSVRTFVFNQVYAAPQQTRETLPYLSISCSVDWEVAAARFVYGPLTPKRSSYEFVHETRRKGLQCCWM